MKALSTKIGILAAMIMGMTGLMTSVMTYATKAESQPFLDAWLPVWLRAAVVIAPFGMVVMYLLNGLLGLLLPGVSAAVRKVLLGLCMAVVMESIMASVTTVQLYGLASGFAAFWTDAMLAALPVAAVMSLVMTFLIKPRLDRVLAS